jgi:hypothetical protein
MLESWAGNDLTEDGCLVVLGGAGQKEQGRGYHQGIDAVENTEGEQIVCCQVCDGTVHIMEVSMTELWRKKRQEFRA